MQWPARPDLRARIRLWLDAACLALIGILLSGGTDLTQANHWTNLNVAITLAAIGVLIIADAVPEAKRLRRKSLPAPAQ